MTNIRELADKLEQYSAGDEFQRITEEAVIILRAQADAADKVREGLNDELMCHYKELIRQVKHGQHAVNVVRAIAAHYAPILAQNEQLRAHCAELEHEVREQALQILTLLSQEIEMVSALRAENE